MPQLLNTLYVTLEGAWLARAGDNVLIRHEGETLAQFPIRTIQGIVCIGNISFSPPLIELLGEHDVALSFLSANGRFLGRLQAPVSGNVLLRRAQYRCADNPDATAAIARSIVIGKIAGCRSLLRRGARETDDPEDGAALADAADALDRVLNELRSPLPLDVLRGKEGEAAKIYFGVFTHLIAGDRTTFAFERRSRRPPLDPINALLSFTYTLLAHDIASALQAHGLDPAVGFLHRDRPGRPGLALDIMEEFRPFLADRLALSLINRRQITARNFTTTPSGAVQMDDTVRKTLIGAWQGRKQEEFTHPFIGEKVPIGLLPHIQAQLLARHLRGELDGYPPLIWK